MDITEEERKGLLNTFKDFGRPKSPEEVFYDLCFCICAPQTTFKNNRIVIDKLVKMDFMHTNPTMGYLEEVLKPVRFYRNKAKYLMKVKKKFPEILEKVLCIEDGLRHGTRFESAHKKRDWLCDNVKGLGMKTASHFLRNLGNTSLAIIDTHILKFMGIEKFPTSRKKYLELERVFKLIADQYGMCVAKLDALIWHRYSGTPWEEFVY